MSIQIYRYNRDNKTWKRLRIEKNKEGRIFVSMSKGKKGTSSGITIMLSEAEAALIVLKLQKMLNE